VKTARTGARSFETFSLERLKPYTFGMGVAIRGETPVPEKSAPPARAKPGRPATASRTDVLRLVAQQYMAGQRVDITVVASRLGLGRATIYRWFGSREALIGEVIAEQLEALVAAKRRCVRRRGAVGLLEVFDLINRSLSRSTALRTFLEQETGAALRLLTSSKGAVQQRGVACVQRLIEAEAAGGHYDPPADPGTLAYAIVRLAEAFLYNDAAVGIRGDHRRLREVQAALLGVTEVRRSRRGSVAGIEARPRRLR
jgi:AcrR family transcriptional regulator